MMDNRFFVDGKHLSSAALEKKYGDAYREIHENATDILAMLNAHDYEGTRSALLKKREKNREVLIKKLMEMT
mgnify:CR=1 FL=1